MTYPIGTTPPTETRIRNLLGNNELLRRELKLATDAKDRAFVRGTCLGILLTLAGFAGAAFAGDTATWGGTGCQLVPVEGQHHVAEVRCVNVQTRGETVTAGDMAVDDLAVHLVIIHGPGDIPDMFTVTPPVGFVAIPPDMSLDENARGTVMIMPWLGG